MVQMAFDGIGRTTNKVFGDASNAPDQRWNNSETYYADNFCNDPTTGAYNAPRKYLYGLFSFTKSMLLHAPGGSLSPIQFLRTQTPNVFPGNSIDWYGALSTTHGGSDPCDGVAQTLVGFQQSDGSWYGNSYDGAQWAFETAWSIIMLNKTVFTGGGCIKNLAGSGAAAGAQPARIDLSWSAQANSSSYSVLRSTTSGSGYAAIGSTTTTSYSDTNGLVDGHTYYYVVQPLNGTSEVCQSNQATVTVPNPSGRR